VKKSKIRSTGRVEKIAMLIVVLFAGWMGASCADTPRSLLSGASVVPPDIEQACTFATMKCTHCHPIERVVLSRGIGVERWQMTINHMRLKPSSGISPSDADVVFRCLRYIEESCIECKQRRS
jgi:hypothetical protein